MKGERSDGRGFGGGGGDGGGRAGGVYSSRGRLGGGLVAEGTGTVKHAIARATIAGKGV